MKLLSRKLTDHGFSVVTADSAATAFNAINDQIPDMILLDVNMPEVSGIDMLKELREEPRTQLLPVIMVSALDQTDDIVTALELGANDYVVKPINERILIARMETHLKLSGLIHNLQIQTELLAKHSAYDELTGCYTRPSLKNALVGELERLKGGGSRLSVAMIGIDHFHKVNDDYGPDGGDEIIRAFVEFLSEQIRATDILGRYEGDKFCVILPDMPCSSAMRNSESIRAAVEQTPFSLSNGDKVDLTVSIGVTEALDLDAADPDAL
ncbi:MAG: diguanylate cyclase, partial [Verrucomicrobiota bacterium]